MSGDSPEPIGQDATGGPVNVPVSGAGATASAGSIGLDAIKEPAAPPAEAPDQRTAQRRIAEREDSDREHLTLMANSPRYRSVVVAEREYGRLSEQVREMSAELQRLHEKVEREGRQLSSLRQAYHDLRGNSSIATLLIAVGSMLGTVAGAISNQTWKSMALYGGGAVFFAGLVFNVYSLLWVRPQS